MAASSRGGVLIAGLILMVLGIIFLLENWYGAFSAWRLLLRWWPLFLIIIGLRKLYCYYTWQKVPPVPELQPKE
jgi:hypothetical protein